MRQAPQHNTVVGPDVLVEMLQAGSLYADQWSKPVFDSSLPGRRTAGQQISVDGDLAFCLVGVTSRQHGVAQCSPCSGCPGTSHHGCLLFSSLTTLHTAAYVVAVAATHLSRSRCVKASELHPNCTSREDQ